MKLHRTTKLVIQAPETPPLRHGLAGWDEDCRSVFGAPLERAETVGENGLVLALDTSLDAERFRLTPRPRQGQLRVEAGDDLGLVFALYHLSRTALGVDPYGFWTDQRISSREDVSLEDAPFLSSPPRARFRGWFINDEDLLIGWHDEMKISLETWRRIFETMLRGGYNMVIPGSGIPASEPQVALASEMGLWITHHHCEPLGSRMYNEYYPGAPLRIPEDLGRFDAIYREAIVANRGRRMVWGLGFRGQGDEAFFKNRPEFDTLEKRGAIISRMMRRQRELVEELHDGPSYFCHNIYAESTELYQAGVLDLDDDVIRVFGDNGFGAMRARPCSYYTVEGDIPACPRSDDRKAPQGVYYHFSFLGGGAASKLTPLVDPELVVDEFNAALDWGNLVFVIANVSAVRPQMFHAELLDRILRPQRQAVEDLAGEQYRAWCERHFPDAAGDVEALYRDYFKAPYRHGTHRDDRAGEQLYHNTLRCIVTGVLTGDESQSISPRHHALRSTPPPLEKPRNVTECIEVLRQGAEASLPCWRSLARRADAVKHRLPETQARVFADTVHLYVHYMHASVEGFVAALTAVSAYREKEWKEAFIHAGLALRWYKQAVRHLVESEHGKWRNFYRGDWKTGSRETVRVVAVLQGMAMLHGNSRDWTRESLGMERLASTVYADWEALAKNLADRRDGRIKGVNVSVLRNPDGGNDVSNPATNCHVRSLL